MTMTSSGNYAKSYRRKNILPSTWKNVNPRKNNAINRVAKKSIERNADKISTWNESPLPLETTKSKSDEIFGKMTVKMVSGITECEEEYLLKLRI